MSKQRNALLGLLCAGALFGVFAGCGSAGQTARPAATVDPSVVAVLGDERLTLDAFEDRYARSVGSPEAAADDSLAAYREFLDRYVDFRLKVLAARAAGLDTSASIREEIDTYRANLARPYLLEQEIVDPIVRDLYAKQQQIVDASHILLRVPPDAPPADTLRAFEHLTRVADSLAQGADFAELAFRHSEDPSVRARPNAPGYQGRLGYFTAGRVVEPFETFAYATPVGEVSPIFRTQFGYHILKVHDRRTAPEDVHVSHIMIRPGPTAEDTLRARALVDSLAQRLAAGDDFAELARQYSADQGSARNGGDLGFISYDMPIVAEFKDVAFALENPGDLSDVVETSFGYHLIRLAERKPRPTFEDSYDALKQAVSRMPRAREAQEAYARSLLAARGARLDTSVVLQAFGHLGADSVLQYLSGPTLPQETTERAFFTLGDSTYTLGDLTAFLPQARFAREADTETLLTELVSQYATDRAIDHEAALLETRDPEFGRVMEEFRDGLVLFKLMEDSVWTAAERDSAALVAHFEAHRPDYRWPDRQRIVGLHARTDSVLAALAARLDAGTSLAALVAELSADSTSAVRVDTMLVAGETGSIYDQALSLAAGAHTAPVQARGGFVMLVNDGLVPAGPKTFEEARPEVVSQYQQILEARLLDRLRRQYDVRVFPERLSGAFDGAGVRTETAAR